MGMLGRRTIALLIAALASVGVVACGSDDDEGGSGGGKAGARSRSRSPRIRTTSIRPTPTR